MWGSTVVPFDAGTNMIVSGSHLTEEEQRGGQIEELGGALTVQTPQPQNKGKEIVKESNARKGRRTSGVGRGKAKTPQASPKSTPKAIWIKRGGGDSEAEQKGAKKPKIAELREANKGKEAEQGKTSMADDKDMAMNVAVGGEVQVLDADKAESGEVQLCQGG